MFLPVKTSSKVLLPTEEGMEKRLPPMEVAKYMKANWQKEHDEGALPHKRTTSVTEEGEIYTNWFFIKL